VEGAWPVVTLPDNLTEEQEKVLAEISEWQTEVDPNKLVPMQVEMDHGQWYVVLGDDSMAVSADVIFILSELNREILKVTRDQCASLRLAAKSKTTTPANRQHYERTRNRLRDELNEAYKLLPQNAD
jgi:hypothetical protein